jgi:hypothetical protein
MKALMNVVHHLVRTGASAPTHQVAWISPANAALGSLEDCVRWLSSLVHPALVKTTALASTKVTHPILVSVLKGLLETIAMLTLTTVRVVLVLTMDHVRTSRTDTSAPALQGSPDSSVGRTLTIVLLSRVLMTVTVQTVSIPSHVHVLQGSRA